MTHKIYLYISLYTLFKSIVKERKKNFLTKVSISGKESCLDFFCQFDMIVKFMTQELDNQPDIYLI